MEQHIFKNMEEYMLSAQNIIRYNKQHSISDSNITLHKHKDSKAIISHKNETIFIPFQKDKLFWSFYIILNGFDTYEFVKNDSFKIEKTFKIQSIEKLRNIKDKLKEFKMKRNVIEDELLNCDTITIKGLEALCLIYNVSLIYISTKKYYDFLFGENKSDIVSGVIINTKNNEHGVSYDCNNTYVSNIRTNYWKMESINKPIRGLSAYTIKDLQDIAIKLEIDLLDNECPSKKKNKKQLYEEILVKL